MAYLKRIRELIEGIQDQLEYMDDRNVHVRSIEDLVLELKSLLGGDEYE